MIENIPKIKFADKGNFFLIAGPCVLENRIMGINICKEIVDITNELEIPFIFKASFEKANRTSVNSFTGIGTTAALHVLKEIGDKFDVPVITDVHSVQDVNAASDYVDILQIPAFLCRQTSLLEAAGKTGKIVNIKKGQFLSPAQMKYAIEKVTNVCNDNVMITERGTTFGYTDLIIDYTGIDTMKKFGKPVILDVTHSLQKPNSSSTTGGRPYLIETVAKAGIAVGFDGIFLETHFNPTLALSDGANMLHLHELKKLLIKLKKLHQVAKEL